MNTPVRFERFEQKVDQYSRGIGPGTSLWWLGQAGFLLRSGSLSILIDPYLSDVLAKKYRGHKFNHKRLMPPPISANELVEINFYLCSHGHTDHLDPETVEIVARNCPDCRFIVPKAIISLGLERGIPKERIIGINAGEEIDLDYGVLLNAIPAAHESIVINERGEHEFLGFLIEVEERTIYHPGDCRPYESLDEYLAPFDIDLALLPINGRRPNLSKQGFAGNFNLEETMRLIVNHRVPYAVVHHFGMFEFNTVGEGAIRTAIAGEGMYGRVIPAEIGIRYHLT